MALLGWGQAPDFVIPSSLHITVDLPAIQSLQPQACSLGEEDRLLNEVPQIIEQRPPPLLSPPGWREDPVLVSPAP